MMRMLMMMMRMMIIMMICSQLKKGVQLVELFSNSIIKIKSELLIQFWLMFSKQT